MTYQATTQQKGIFSRLAKQAKKEPVFITEEKQKIGVFISFEYFVKFQEWEENQKLEKKFKEWEATLPVREATPEEEKAILKGEEDIKNGRFKTKYPDDPRTASEFLGIK